MPELNGFYKVPLVAATTTAAGGVVTLLNPEGRDLIITRCVLDVRTQSTGAATLDIGVATTVATNDGLLDGISVAAVGSFDNVSSIGTNGKAAVRWGATSYLTATASATTAGLVGNLYVQYVRL